MDGHRILGNALESGYGMRMCVRAVVLLTSVCVFLAHGGGKTTPTAPSTLRPGATGLSDRVTGTPDVLMSSGATDRFPHDFFTTTVTRGLLYTGAAMTSL